MKMSCKLVPSRVRLAVKTAALALVAAGALAMSATVAAAQSRDFAPAVYPQGPSYAYAPAYYIYVPAHPGPYAADGVTPAGASRYVFYDDVYPPAIYGPRLRAVGPRYRQ